MKPYAPAGFCAVLSLMALVGVIGASALTPGHTVWWWAPGFFSFLPMCFYLVGTNTVHMGREIQELRQKLADLERMWPGQARSDAPADGKFA